jgi:hypothetical protein
MIRTHALNCGAAGVRKPATDFEAIGDFRRRLRELAYRYAEPVSEDDHIRTVEDFANQLSQAHPGALANGRLRIGMAQKAVNLFLKFLWCIAFTVGMCFVEQEDPTRRRKRRGRPCASAVTLDVESRPEAGRCFEESRCGLSESNSPWRCGHEGQARGFRAWRLFDAFEKTLAELGVFVLVRRGATGDGHTGRLVENLREIAWDGFRKTRTVDEFLLSDAADMVYSSQSGSLDRRNLCRIR